MAIINDLPVMSTPASGDELPIERGTTVYKIDYNALAAAIIAQQSLTGVKGNAESTYRTGNVNLTPANLGAVAASAIIDISHGGTGQSTQDGMRNAVFYNTSTTGISSYPTTTGLFRTTGTLPAGMPSGASAYGVLTIVGAGTYYTHLYVDASQNMYYAESSAAGAPSTWRKLTGTTVSPVT